MEPELQTEPASQSRSNPKRGRWLIVSAAASSATPAADPARLSHGPGETVLTGTTADKVKAAALAAGRSRPERLSPRA